MSRRIDPIEKALALWRDFTPVQKDIFDGRTKEYRLAHGEQTEVPVPRKPRRKKTETEAVNEAHNAR